MNDSPLISCIITTYKRGIPFVAKAVNSVLAQTYKNIELIIVDDNHVPNDYSKDISDYVSDLNDIRITYLKLERNMGACAARNYGIDFSRGEFVAFLDDDDEWLTEKLAKQYNKMTNPEIGLVYCSAYHIYPDHKIIRPHKLKNGLTSFEQIFIGNFIGSTSFPLIRKICFSVCGKFDELLNSSQDLDMWIRILKHYEIAFVDEPLCNYYIHDENQITKNLNAKIESLEQIYNKYYNDIKINPNLNNMRLLINAIHYARVKKTGTSVKLWVKACILCPWKVTRNILYLFKIIKYSVISRLH